MMEIPAPPKFGTLGSGVPEYISADDDVTVPLAPDDDDGYARHWRAVEQSRTEQAKEWLRARGYLVIPRPARIRKVG